eukprot:Em0016g849a
MEEKGNTTMATRGSCPLTSRQGTSLPSERAPQTHRKRLEVRKWGGARGDKRHKNALCVVESLKDDDIIMSEVELDKDMFQKVLVEIGDHIQECIKSYGDGVMEKPQKLYKIYKKARKERGKEDMPVKRHYLESSEQGSSQHSTSNLKSVSCIFWTRIYCCIQDLQQVEQVELILQLDVERLLDLDVELDLDVWSRWSDSWTWTSNR